MSYKYTVLQDKPISFFMLDEVRSGTVGSYTSLMSNFATYQDLKDNGVSYSALSGLPVYDYSGNTNDGYALGASQSELMPLVAGTVRGTRVLTDTQIHLPFPGVATKYYSDNSFDIEIWANIPDYNDSEFLIIGDKNNDIGIFYNNGNIIFRVGEYEIQHTYSNKQAVHIVGQFSSSMLALYIDGIRVSTLQLDKYKFTNNDVEFLVNPAVCELVVDAVAFYKFNMSNIQIRKHYLEGSKEINYFQIVHSDNGYLFTLNSSAIRPAFKYSYPKSKTWNELSEGDIIVSSDGQSIYFQKTDTALEKEFSFTDQIFIPEHLGITTSQVYWEPDINGITVEASLDGNVWSQCNNREALPFFNKNDNQVSNSLYLRVTVSSADTSKYLPYLNSLYIDFFKNKTVYADNFGCTLSSDYDYSLPPFNSKTLSANRHNGLRMYNGHGFSLSDGVNAESIEMIFTPSTGKNVLFSAPSKIYEWNNSGNITKTGISSIYVNGINRTSSTNISDFLTIDMPHHIVINLSSASGSGIKFNQNQGDTNSGSNHMYSNIAIYESALSEANILNHYLLYTDNLIMAIDDAFLTITEDNEGTDSTPFRLVVVQPDAISL